LKTITASWIVLLWPFYTTAWGIVIGNLMAKVSGAPKSFRCAAMAAVAFGNSTGLPITLVSIIHNAASPKSPLSATDPAIFVSIYLIFNPILQWSVGSWLLEAPSDVQQPEDENGEHNHNNKEDNNNSKKNKNGSYEKVSQFEMVKVHNPLVGSNSNLLIGDGQQDKTNFGSLDDIERSKSDNNSVELNSKSEDTPSPISVGEVCAIVYRQLAQPAIIASLCGLFIACIGPLHDLLVDTKDQRGGAPFEFVFDALHTVGTAAIPVYTKYSNKFYI
jgi:predicted permease